MFIRHISVHSKNMTMCMPVSVRTPLLHEPLPERGLFHNLVNHCPPAQHIWGFIILLRQRFRHLLYLDGIMQQPKDIYMTHFGRHFYPM